MNYSNIALSINKQVTSLKGTVSNINSIDLASVWNSTAYKSLSLSLTNVINDLNTEIGNLEQFSSALVMMDEYVALVKEIERMIEVYNSMPASTPEEVSAKENYGAQIEAKIVLKNELREKIVSILSVFGAISSEYSSVNFVMDSDGNFNYVVDVNALLAMFESGNLDITKSLYGLYNETDENGKVIKGSGSEFVNAQLEQVLKNYSGREATINSVLIALQLAADKGYKLRYVHAGSNMGSVPYNTNDQLQDGMDCCAFVSWGINKGTPEPFHWEGVQPLRKMGEGIDYDDWSEAQPGDIFVNSKHVGFIIENNPETQEFVVADARGEAYGVVMRTVSYSSLKNDGCDVRNMESYYTGEETNINPLDHT